MPEQTVEVVALTVEQLYRYVRDQFAEDGSTTSVVYGRRAVTQQTNQGTGGANRVTFVPGDPTGKAGRLTAPKGMGSPERIYGHATLFQIRFWACDAGAPNDEAAQSDAVWALVGQTLNYVRLFGMGRVRDKEWTWTVTPIERVFGAELTAVCELDVPIEALPRAAIPAQPADEPEATVSMVFPAGDVVACPHDEVP